MGHSKAPGTRAIHSLTQCACPHGAHFPTHARTATCTAHKVLRAVDKSSSFSLGTADCTRGPARRWAPSTWHARASGRTSRSGTCMATGRRAAVRAVGQMRGLGAGRYSLQ